MWYYSITFGTVSTLGQSGYGSDGNEGVLHIPQSSSITESSPSDFCMSYPEHPLKVGYSPSKDMQSVYSTGPANRDI